MAFDTTRDEESGAGGRSDAEIVQAVTKGGARGGARLKPPMGCGYHARMTAADLEALVAWPRAVPAKE